MIKIKNKKLALRNDLPIYLMFAPYFILFFLFTILPILASVVLSFTSYDMISTPKFAGLQNYFTMFLDDKIIPIVVKNTLVFAIVTGPAGFILSFVLAWFINEFKPIIRTVLSFLFYAPALVGNGLFIWQILFSGDSYGYLNSFLLSTGFITEPIVWLSDSNYIMKIVILVQLWQGMGVSFLANIAGLQNVSEELYEAGAIDGIRNRWQELWYITLPTMANMLIFSAVMQIQSSFSVSSITTALAGYPSVEYAADTIVSYLSDVGTTYYEMGYASAISVVLFLMMIFTRQIVITLLNKITV